MGDSSLCGGSQSRAQRVWSLDVSSFESREPGTNRIGTQAPDSKKMCIITALSHHRAPLARGRRRRTVGLLASGRRRCSARRVSSARAVPAYPRVSTFTTASPPSCSGRGIAGNKRGSQLESREPARSKGVEGGEKDRGPLGRAGRVPRPERVWFEWLAWERAQRAEPHIAQAGVPEPTLETAASRSRSVMRVVSPFVLW